MVSLILIAGGCWVMGTEKVHSRFFLDSVLIGYLMIAVGVSQISVASFHEILIGTSNYIEKSVWRDFLAQQDGQSQIYVESAYLCMALHQLAYIIGPPLGGLLVIKLSMNDACYLMAKISTWFCLFYLLMYLLLHFISSNMQSKEEDAKKKKVRSILKKKK